MDELKPCPFCGGKPYIDSCDRLINIGCKPCGYTRYFYGLVQSDHKTDVVVSYNQNTNEPLEWYDPNAYKHACEEWNRRADDRLPSVDAVQVVRCKDCKYFSAVDNRFFKTQECYRIMIPDEDEDFPIDTTEDSFCSWAERKDDD